ncbi:family 43 glycosylhydrolase [Pontiellaceae bacterium B12227]|nr:family 43 glycosylhydrolase [Pontiellaceae bacterium B12227]
MMKSKTIQFSTLLTLCAAMCTQADNPLVYDVGMADPHIFIFEDKAYMYTTHDDKEAATVEWNMPDWNIWSSDDLVDWKHERTVKPAETYIGESIYCWAPNAATKNGKYYFYLSNKLIDTAVMVSDSPAGPFKDALGKPLLPEDLTPTHEYDICVLFDNGSPYIVFGAHQPHRAEKGHTYHIAKLNDDMISLADEPKPLVIDGPPTFRGDKPNIHFHRGTYYLTTGAHWATSDNLYGPYTVKWSESDDSHPHDWSRRAHGNFFEWNRQWFWVYCSFVDHHDTWKYRQSQMTYVHYKDNGDIVYDSELLDSHYKAGVGQYGADWPVIQAEWFMGMSEGPEKREHPVKGFEIQNIRNGNSLRYPNIHNCPTKPVVKINYSSNGLKGTVTIKENDANGPVVGTATFDSTGSWQTYSTVSVPLTAGKENATRSLFFEFSGDNGKELIRVDSFTISK